MKSRVFAGIVVLLGFVGLFTFKYLDEKVYHFSDTKIQKIIRAELPESSKHGQITVGKTTTYEFGEMNYYVSTCFTIQNNESTPRDHVLLFPISRDTDWVLADHQTLEYALFCEDETMEHIRALAEFVSKTGRLLYDLEVSYSVPLPEPRK